MCVRIYLHGLRSVYPNWPSDIIKLQNQKYPTCEALFWNMYQSKLTSFILLNVIPCNPKSKADINIKEIHDHFFAFSVPSVPNSQLNLCLCVSNGSYSNGQTFEEKEPKRLRMNLRSWKWYHSLAGGTHGRMKGSPPHWSNSIGYFAQTIGRIYTRNACYKVMLLSSRTTARLLSVWRMDPRPKRDFTLRVFGQNWTDFRTWWLNLGASHWQQPVQWNEYPQIEAA